MRKALWRSLRPKMTHFVWGWIVGLGLIVVGIGIYRIGARRALEDGLRPAPLFSLPRADGGSLALSNLNDHVVVVHFWAAWCPPCLPEIPEILSAAKKLPKDQQGRPIYWVLITQDDDWEKAHKVLPESLLSENVISLMDAKANVSDSFGSYQFPETYLLTRGGGIAAKWIGPQEWSGEWGKQALIGIESLSRLQKVSAGP